MSAFRRVDLANAADPNQEVVNGQSEPKELVYSRRMTDRLARFAPNASEALRLAARCQHIQRWTISRADFPEGRMGYRRWRTTLATFHAETAGALLQEVGYDDATVTRVQTLLRKENLKTDVEVQTLEDVACLVFLEHYAAAFAAKQDAAKLVEILRKTWRKMSEQGREAALRVDLVPAVRTLVEQATE